MCALPQTRMNFDWRWLYHGKTPKAATSQTENQADYIDAWWWCFRNVSAQFRCIQPTRLGLLDNRHALSRVNHKTTSDRQREERSKGGAAYPARIVIYKWPRSISMKRSIHPHFGLCAVLSEKLCIECITSPNARNAEWFCCLRIRQSQR